MNTLHVSMQIAVSIRTEYGHINTGCSAPV